MIYVLDASFLAATIIPDEVTPQIKKMYGRIENEDTRIVPQLVWYEMANVFNNLIRRRRFNYNEVIQLLPLLEAVRLTTDYESGVLYTEKLLHLCNDYNISSYDASYMELAGRKKAVLCTLDENLKTAAKKYGVTVIK